MMSILKKEKIKSDISKYRPETIEDFDKIAKKIKVNIKDVIQTYEELLKNKKNYAKLTISTRKNIYKTQ